MVKFIITELIKSLFVSKGSKDYKYLIYFIVSLGSILLFIANMLYIKGDEKEIGVFLIPGTILVYLVFIVNYVVESKKNQALNKIIGDNGYITKVGPLILNLVSGSLILPFFRLSKKVLPASMLLYFAFKLIKRKSIGRLYK